MTPTVMKPGLPAVSSYSEGRGGFQWRRFGNTLEQHQSEFLEFPIWSYGRSIEAVLKCDRRWRLTVRRSLVQFSAESVCLDFQPSPGFLVRVSVALLAVLSMGATPPLPQPGWERLMQTGNGWKTKHETSAPIESDR